MEERITTRHPQGKVGVNISKAKYDVLRGAITDSLQKQGEMTFSELGDAVRQRLEGNFEGSNSWYYTTVKLDLEARGLIERVGTGSPQLLRLRPKGNCSEPSFVDKQTRCYRRPYEVLKCSESQITIEGSFKWE